jgi:hypothetical protein
VEPVSRLKADESQLLMTLQSKTFNLQHPTSNIQVTDAGKLGGSALNACSRDSGVECSMFVREISRRATIWTDGSVAAGILSAIAGGILAGPATTM